MTIQPQNPYAVNVGPGGAPMNETGGRNGENFVVDIHGKYYTGNYYGKVFNFIQTALTIPVIASGLVSVCSLYNTSSSTANLELVDIDIGIVLATQVVDVTGLYWDGPTLATKATFTTKGVFATNWFAGNLGGNPGQGIPYSALTHSTTPVRIDIINTFGALTTTADIPIHRDYEGKILMPPGHLISVAMSTAASTTSGLDVSVRWQECLTV